MISAIIISKNEERNIERCLNSLKWVEEVILVDGFSTDRTTEIASKFSNVKIHQSEWLGYAATKKLAVNFAKNDWIFWVDADEEVTPELQNEIREELNKSGQIMDAFSMPRKTFFIGQWIKRCGWYPGFVKRLFNKNYVRFNDNLVHEGLEMDHPEKAKTLKSDLLHFSYYSTIQYFSKMELYGKLGADELIRKKKQFSFLNLFINPVFTFFKFYILKFGFLDGVAGFVISAGNSFSTFVKYSHFYYQQKEKKNV